MSSHKANYFDTHSIQDEKVIGLAEKFAVMQQQESTSYRCKDYLSNPPPAIPRELTKPVQFSFPGLNGSSASLSSSSSQSSVNEIWREKICEWSYQVVDHYDFNREVVSISLSYLDRFLSTRRVNKKIFQLAAMTTLYLAIKIHERGKLKMSSLIELSRGYFMVEHVSAMEEEILSALSWHVHPPTPLTQVRHILLLLPPICNTSSIVHDITELSRFLTELSVCDYFFVTHKFSSIAMAAILTAMEAVEESRLLSQYQSEFLKNVREIAKIDVRNPDVEECRLRIREMYYEGGYYQNNNEVDVIQEQKGADRCESISPVNVAGEIQTPPPSQYDRNTHFQPCHHSYSCDQISNISYHHNCYGNKKARQV